MYVCMYACLFQEGRKRVEGVFEKIRVRKSQNKANAWVQEPQGILSRIIKEFIPKYITVKLEKKQKTERERENLKSTPRREQITFKGVALKGTTNFSAVLN